MSGRVLVVTAGGWAAHKDHHGARRVFVYSQWTAAAARPPPALSCSIPTPRHERVFSDLSLSDFRALGEGLGEGLG